MSTADRTPSLDSPRVLVVGAGAVGGLYGGKLSQAGARVSLVCRSDFEAVRAHGLQVRSHWGDFHFAPEKVVRSAGEYGDGADYVLVTHKVLPDADTVELVRGAVGPGTTICLLQNGVEIEAPVAKAFPDNEILSCLAFVCIVRPEPGVVEHQDFGPLTLGSYPKGVSKKARRLGALFEKAGVPLTLAEDIVGARWKKLIWNAPFSSMTVLAGRSHTRHIVDDPDALQVARAVMEEVAAIAAALGHPINDAFIEENLDRTRRMTPYRPSMLQDYEAKRPMETEALLGAPVRIARREGVPVPHMDTLYALLKLAEERNRV